MDFKPNWASLPGNTILDILNDKNISESSLARMMATTPEYIRNIIEGNIIITKEIASELSRNLGASENFWITRQEQYQESCIRLEREKDDLWMKELPVKDMLKYGWISNTKDKLKECLSFFDVPDVQTWRDKYESLISYTAFRKSTSFESDRASIATWLRFGEIKASQTKCSDWDKELFENNLLKIRTLTRKKDPADFVPALKKYCAECGVAVVIARTPQGCRASGATKFIASNKAMLLLSFRYLSDDQFWFTFFHEAGHLLLHSNTSIFIETSDTHKDSSEVELEANTFAGEVLIPYSFHSEFSKIRGNKRNIIGFAMKVGVSPGIVIGQLQHYGYISPKYLNDYKRKYNWDDINLII